MRKLRSDLQAASDRYFSRVATAAKKLETARHALCWQDDDLLFAHIDDFAKATLLAQTIYKQDQKAAHMNATTIGSVYRVLPHLGQDKKVLPCRFSGRLVTLISIGTDGDMGVCVGEYAQDDLTAFEPDVWFNPRRLVRHAA